MPLDGILGILSDKEIEMGWENTPHTLFCGYPLEKERFLHVVDWKYVHVPDIDIMDMSEKSSIYGPGSSSDEDAEEMIEHEERQEAIVDFTDDLKNKCWDDSGKTDKYLGETLVHQPTEEEIDAFQILRQIETEQGKLDD